MILCQPFGSAPLATPVRFKLVAATEQDQQALRGLGTYGFIRRPAGFVIGAVCQTHTGASVGHSLGKNLEDLGYLMEQVILYATDLGLGTCWLGGSFTKSSFAKKMSLGDDELLPAVVSLGYIAEKRSLVDRFIYQYAGSKNRLPWNRLFFDGEFGSPLGQEAAEAYAVPLEMVRLGPSASNKQPWRIIRDGDAGAWHFYLQRTPGYHQGGKGSFVVADLQRIDIGIAMCHFGLTAGELGLEGRWIVRDPGIKKPDSLTEYVVTWVG